MKTGHRGSLIVLVPIYVVSIVPLSTSTYHSFTRTFDGGGTYFLISIKRFTDGVDGHLVRSLRRIRSQIALHWAARVHVIYGHILVANNLSSMQPRE